MLETKIKEPSHLYQYYYGDDKAFLITGGNLYFRSRVKDDYFLLKKDYIVMNKQIYDKKEK